MTSPENRCSLASWSTGLAAPYGTGLVATIDNLGAKSSHPELLDYLAAEFVRSGWSLKAMHRLIMSSAVYCQSSASRDGLEAIDPDNRLLARYPIRRLDAESVRDSLLHMSGELDRRAGGPYVASKRTPEGIVEIAENEIGAQAIGLSSGERRCHVPSAIRCASIVTTCGKRSPSTVLLQSLAHSIRVRAESGQEFRPTAGDRGRR